MNTRSLIRKTLFLSASHFIVRAIGFAMRIWLSRELGALTMGLVELAQSAQMLLITPVVSGLPAAVSRMCAKAKPAQQVRILRCGAVLALMISLPLSIAAFYFRVPLALWLGDLRTLPALVVYLPCIPVLGVSCVLNGYYYGMGRPVPPSLCELLEQIVRFFLSVRLVALLRPLPMMLRAAAPAAAALLGETAALILMLLIAARSFFFTEAQGSRLAILRELFSLALPLTAMRLVSSLMRTAQSALIPAQLQRAGLSAAQALSGFGMISGMMMPILTIPSFITCSLCMVVQPEITRRQSTRTPQKRLIMRLLHLTLCLGLIAMTGVYLLAPLFAKKLYREAALLALLRGSCPLVPIMALCQVSSGFMNALGLQGTSLRISIGANLLGVLLMYTLAAQPFLRLWGVIIAMAVSQGLTLVCSLRALFRASA